MKVLLLKKNGNTFTVEGGADSAILRLGEPVFVPEPADEWVSCICPAIVIDLLGTHIPEASARRHYSRGTLLHLTVPATNGESPVPPLFIDRAVAPGDRVSLEELGAPIRVTRSSLDGSHADTLCGPGLTLALADKAVAFVSRYMTLKTGDIIAFSDYAIPLGAPVLDTRVTACAADNKCLDIKIK